MPVPGDLTSRFRTVWRVAGLRGIDGAAVLALFVAAGVWGAAYWSRVDAGKVAPFYQGYFEPAVMIACGKGFVISQPPLENVAEFLTRQVDRFSCDAIPPETRLGTQGLFQGAWRYLMYAVGLTWRIFGISWSGLGPLFGVLFGATVVAAYGIFRLGLSPAFSFLGASALTVSSLHLSHLPQLRDYSKAPFTLILVFLLGLLVKRRPTKVNVLSIAAAYGLTVGIGYGFRTDFLVNIPVFFLVLFAFLENGPLRLLGLKAAAAAVCAAAFLLSAWPILSTVYTAGGCQWHTALLGLSSDFSDPLGVQPAPYELSPEYVDDFVYVSATSYAARVEPGVGHIEFCQPPYDRATGRYLADLVIHFPADAVVRTYASALRIVELPWAWMLKRTAEQTTPPTPRKDRANVWAGLVFVVAAVALTSMVSVRVALFLVFFVLYFCGYPAIQFSVRHYFHLEFVSWWAAGFTLQHVAAAAWRRIREGRSIMPPPSALARAGAVLAASAATLILALWAARVYQQREARALFSGYLAAAKEDIALSTGASGFQPVPRVAPMTDPETADLLQIDFDVSRCGSPAPSVTFAYEPHRKAFSRTFVIPSGSGQAHVFEPVYDGFLGVTLGGSPPGCVNGIRRLRDPRKFPLLVEAVLPPGWDQVSLFQRLNPQPW